MVDSLTRWLAVAGTWNLASKNRAPFASSKQTNTSNIKYAGFKISVLAQRLFEEEVDHLVQE